MSGLAVGPMVRPDRSSLLGAGVGGDEGADLDEVVGEHAVAAPGSCAVESVEAGSVEPEVAFGAADPSFASGAPSDHLVGTLGGSRSGGARAFGLPLRWQHDVAHPGGAQVVLDAVFAVAAVGGDRAWCPPGAAL